MIERDSAIALQLHSNVLTLTHHTAAGSVHQLMTAPLTGIYALLGQGNLTGAKVETAISEIEDLIMPALRNLEVSIDLKLAGHALQRIVQLLDNDGKSVSIAAIECLFNQLVDVANGAPVRLYQVSTAPDDILALTLLRAVMLHGRFSSASLSTSAAHTSSPPRQ